MQVDTSVAEADIGKLKAGMEATFTVDAFPAKAFKGTVRQIRNAPQTVQNVVTYDAVIDVANPDLELRPGHDRQRDVRLRPPRGRAARRQRGAALPPAARARPRRGRRRLVRWPAGGPRAAVVRGRGRDSGRRGPRGGRQARARRRPIGGRCGCCAGRQAEPVRVQVGVTDGTNTEIETGELHEGDRVITDAETTGGDAKGRRRPGRRVPPDVLMTAVSSEPNGIVDVEAVTKVYKLGDVEVHALRGVDARDRQRRVRRDHGLVGLGQVDADEHPRLPRQADDAATSSSPASRCRDARLATGWRRIRNRTLGFVFQSFNLLPRTERARERRAAAALRRRTGAPSGASGRARRSSGSGSASGSTTTRTSCRAASSSAWRSRARS